MSHENVEIVRSGIEAWNQHDAERWLSYAAPEIEWRPAGPAAVESTVYRCHDDVGKGFASVWQSWGLFAFAEREVRDIADDVLRLGRGRIKGPASQVDLDGEF